MRHIKQLRTHTGKFIYEKIIEKIYQFHRVEMEPKHLLVSRCSFESLLEYLKLTGIIPNGNNHYSYYQLLGMNITFVDAFGDFLSLGV